MECPVCKKGFDENTGRRPKRFCSDPCKVKFWNANKKPPKPQIQDFSKPTNKVPDLSKEPPKTNYTVDMERISELEKEIEAIPDKTKGLGKMMAESIRKKIVSLKYNK